jgi:hypothetical protein
MVLWVLGVHGRGEMLHRFVAEPVILHLVMPVDAHTSK